jgi:hypothetical protein
MPTWTRGVLPGRRKEWRKAGRWNPVTAGARDGAPASAPAPVAATSWTSARPTGARGGALIGQGRASAPGPAPTQDEEEALEQEQEQELPRLQEEQAEEEQEHDASPDDERRPGAYAYVQSGSTGYDEPPPLSQKDKSKDKVKEREKEKESSEQEAEQPPLPPPPPSTSTRTSTNTSNNSINNNSINNNSSNNSSTKKKSNGNSSANSSAQKNSNSNVSTSTDAATPSTGYDEAPTPKTKSKSKDKAREKEKEREKESSEQEQEQDLPPRHPSSYAYVGTPSTAYDEAPQRASTPASAADPYVHDLPHLNREDADAYTQAISLVPEDPKAAARSDLERQVAGHDQLAGEDPSTWAPLQESKPHHNRLVARLAAVHVDEKGKHREDLIDVARDSAKTLKKHWKRIEELRTEVPPDDAEKVADFIDWLPEPLDSHLEGKSHAELLDYFTRQHANLYVRLRRQNIPVSPDGTLDEKSAAITERKVGYDETEEAQAATLVHIDTAGKLRRNTQGNPPVDTSNSATHFSGGGVEIFVVGVDGDIHLHSHAIGQYHHSSLLNGGDVAMAGEMKVVNGTIEWLSDKSGHYVPSLDHLLQFLHRLKKDRVPLNFELRGFNVPKGKKYTGAELLESSPDTGEDAWTKIKTKLVLEGFAASKDEAAVLEAIAAAGWRREADGSVVDAGGTPVPDRELRRHLKRHFGYKSPRKVLRGESVPRGDDVKPPENLGFRPTVRSSDELVPKDPPPAPPAPTGSPAATLTPLQQRATTTTAGESEAMEKEKEDEDDTEATPGGYMTDEADEGRAGTYGEKPAPPSTGQTKLLAGYEEAYGREPVAQVLQRESLYLDDDSGCVRDFMDRALTLDQLAMLLNRYLGPLPEQRRQEALSPGNYAAVPATAYSEVENQ